LDVAELRDKAVDAANFLKSMSNQSRLLILGNLVDGDKTVGERQLLVGLSQSALSKHLAVVRRDELVDTRRSGQSIYHQLQSELVQEIMPVYSVNFCE